MKKLIKYYIFIPLTILTLTGCSVADLFSNDEDIPTLYCYNTNNNESNLIHSQTKDSYYGMGFDNILWSPNSKYIAYTDLYKEDISLDIYINTPTGSNLITIQSYYIPNFGWNDDSTTFYFIAEDGVTKSYTINENTITTSNININQLSTTIDNSNNINLNDNIYSPNSEYFLYLNYE